VAGTVLVHQELRAVLAAVSRRLPGLQLARNLDQLSTRSDMLLHDVRAEW